MKSFAPGLLAALLVAGLAVLVLHPLRQIRRLEKEQPVLPSRGTPAAGATDRVPGQSSDTRLRENPEPAPAATPKAPAPAGSGMMAEIARLTQSPGMKDLIRAQQKGQLDLLYGSLFQYLELSGVDVQAARELLLDRQMAILGLALESMNRPVPPRERANRLRQVNADCDARIRELLGPEHYEVYESYEAAQAERAQVTLFKGALAPEDRLTEDQEDRLIRAFHEERSRSEVATEEFGEKLSDPSQLSPEEVDVLLRESASLREKYLSRAAPILTPRQLEQFKANQVQQQAMLETAIRMSAGLFKGPVDPAPAPAE